MFAQHKFYCGLMTKFEFHECEIQTKLFQLYILKISSSWTCLFGIISLVHLGKQLQNLFHKKSEMISS